MQKFIRVFLIGFLMSIVIADAEEGRGVEICPKMVSSASLDESLACYKKTYISAQKGEDIVDYIHSLTQIRQLLNEVEFLVKNNEKIKDKESLLKLLKAVDLSNERFNRVLEDEKQTVKKLYATEDKNKSKELQAYYQKYFLPTIERQIDLFFEKLKKISIDEDLQVLHKEYMNLLDKSMDTLQKSYGSDDNVLVQLQKKVQKNEPFNEKMQNAYANVIFGLYLRREDSTILGIRLKHILFDLQERQEILINNLTDENSRDDIDR